MKDFYLSCGLVLQVQPSEGCYCERCSSPCNSLVRFSVGPMICPQCAREVMQEANQALLLLL